MADNTMTASTAPGFSVVIPVYNGAEYIEKAIISCLHQTVLPEEIIVINDGSTDATGKIVENMVSGLVKLMVNDEKRGPSFSRNKGLRAATSAWILFLDADDHFHPDKISILRDCIIADPGISAIGHAFSVPNQAVPSGFGSGQARPERISTFRVLLSNPVVTPALAVKKENNVFFDEQMFYAEDHDFILRTTEQHGLWYIDLPLCSLGREPLSPGGLSGKKWEMRKGEMKMYAAYCKRKRILLATPFLLMFSIGKHIRSMLKFNNR